MMVKTSGDSSSGVSEIIFSGIQDSFTTQGTSRPQNDPALQLHAGVNCHPDGNLTPSNALMHSRSDRMPYALFCNEAKLSKAYPTEADVWKQARNTGLVVDVATDEDRPAPRPVLDNDYEIRPCRPDPHEDPARNQAEAEREAEFEFQL
jgi:hypothetical protein